MEDPQEIFAASARVEDMFILSREQRIDRAMESLLKSVPTHVNDRELLWDHPLKRHLTAKNASLWLKNPTPVNMLTTKEGLCHLCRGLYTVGIDHRVEPTHMMVKSKPQNRGGPDPFYISFNHHQVRPIQSYMGERRMGHFVVKGENVATGGFSPIMTSDKHRARKGDYEAAMDYIAEQLHYNHINLMHYAVFMKLDIRCHPDLIVVLTLYSEYPADDKLHTAGDVPAELMEMESGKSSQ